MKKTSVILLCIIFIIVIVIFFNKPYIINEIKPNVNMTMEMEPDNTIYEETPIRYMDKITMTIKNGTLSPTGLIVIITDDNETPYNSYIDWYRIHKNLNGQWIELKPIDENYVSDELATYENFEIKIDWSETYGILEEGQYRLVTSIFDNEEKYFYLEFSIKK